MEHTKTADPQLGFMPLLYGSLFSGIGGIDLGFDRAGLRCAWQVEINPFARKVLEKHWPGVPKHDDIRTFRPTPVDVVCGGFPCQDISNAGKRKGIEGERSGLWFEYLRIIREIRPRFVVVENVAALLVRGFDRVLGGLAECGYDAEWRVLSACQLGAPHARERLFCVAYRDKERRWVWGDHVRNTPRFDHWKATEDKRQWRDMELWIRENFSYSDRPADSSEFQRMADGIPDRVERVGACGNAVVPQIAQWIGQRLVESV